MTKFVSDSLAQAFAYSNLLLLLIGTGFIIKQREEFSPLIRLWVVFFLLYYTLGILANINLDTEPPLLKTMVPVVYFITFSFLLSKPMWLKPTGKVLSIAFFLSCIFLILFNYLNFSVDHDGVYEFDLERAGGVYGDANNASVAAILSFVFLKYFFLPRNKLEKIYKITAMIISVYGVIITFSKTGFIVFFIVLCFVYHKLFSIKKILFTIIFLPLTLFIVTNWARTSDTLSFSQKQRVESLVNIATLNSDKVGFSDRDVLFKNMMTFIYERPFLGNGISFSTIIRGHNTIVGVWADAGIIVFLVFLFLLISYYKKTLSIKNGLKFFSLAVLITLTLFMLTLQSIINQGYLMVVFVFIGYLLYNPSENFKITNEQNSSFT